MTWTLEKLATIPEVYRDFMTVLKPVIDSRDPKAILKITGIPFSKFANALSFRHDYDAEQVWEVAQQLRQQGLVDGDAHGIYTPTAKGESLIQALEGAEDLAGHRVPTLPQL
jgi:hypothetical protein